MGNGEDFSVLEIDPSVATDQDIIDCLRPIYERYKSEKAARGVDKLEVNAHLAGMHPSKLPSCFVSTGQTLKQFWQIEHGLWKENLFPSIIRDFATVLSSWSYAYTGVKRTLEFHLHDGTKTDWVMIQYHMLNRNGRDDLFIEDDLVLCKVFQRKGKGQLPNQGSLHQSRLLSSLTIPGPIPESIGSYSYDLDDFFNNSEPEDYDMDGPLSPQRQDQLRRCISSLNECINRENQHSVNKHEALQPKTKRPRSGADGKSDVWNHFTKIYTKVPGADGKFRLAYAACHYCDRLLKADSVRSTNV